MKKKFAKNIKVKKGLPRNVPFSEREIKQPNIKNFQKFWKKEDARKEAIEAMKRQWKNVDKLLAKEKQKKVHYSKTLKGKIAELEFDRTVLNNIIQNHLDLSKLDKSSLDLYNSIKKKISVNHMTIQRRTVNIVGDERALSRK